MEVYRLLKHFTNVIQTSDIVLNILVTKVYISQRKGLVRYYVSKSLMKGLVQVTDALELRDKAH